MFLRNNVFFSQAEGGTFALLTLGCPPRNLRAEGIGPGWLLLGVWVTGSDYSTLPGSATRQGCGDSIIHYPWKQNIIEEIRATMAFYPVINY